EKSLSTALNVFAKRMELFGKGVLTENHQSVLRAKFSSESFLEPFAKKVGQLFTEEEMFQLLDVLHSELMEKFLSHYQSITSSLYFAMEREADRLVCD